jgi:hypothetical protein
MTRSAGLPITIILSAVVAVAIGYLFLVEGFPPNGGGDPPGLAGVSVCKYPAINGSESCAVITSLDFDDVGNHIVMDFTFMEADCSLCSDSTLLSIRFIGGDCLPGLAGQGFTYEVGSYTYDQVGPCNWSIITFWLGNSYASSLDQMQSFDRIAFKALEGQI